MARLARDPNGEVLTSTARRYTRCCRVKEGSHCNLRSILQNINSSTSCKNLFQRNVPYLRFTRIQVILDLTWEILAPKIKSNYCQYLSAANANGSYYSRDNNYSPATIISSEIYVIEKLYTTLYTVFNFRRFYNFGIT